MGRVRRTSRTVLAGEGGRDFIETRARDDIDEEALRLSVGREPSGRE